MGKELVKLIAGHVQNARIFLPIIALFFFSDFNNVYYFNWFFVFFCL